MLSFLGKSKVTDNQVSSHFVATTLQIVEDGWPIVAGFICDSPEFVIRPDVREDDYGRFLMIVIAANFNFIPQHFDDGHDRAIIQEAVDLFAEQLDVKRETLACKIKEYREFLSRVNHPSKNTLYAMSRGIFYKYELNQYQEEYFRSLNTPNPIFLKNMNEILGNFLWEWDKFKNKYRVV